MAPNTITTEQSLLKPQELVDIAREILVSNTNCEDGMENTQNMVKMASPQGTEKQVESPTARFTAVNGRNQIETSPTTNGNGNSNGMNGNGVARRGSDERPNGQPRISPPGHEKLTITTTQDHQDWPSTTTTNGERTHLPDRQMNISQNSNHYSDENSHKRKRSGSMDQGSSSANSYHSHALPNSTKATPTTATTESDGIRDDTSARAKSQSQVDSREPYDSQYRQFMSANESVRDATPNDMWHSRHYPQQHSQVNSDEHLGEVLQRASQSLDAQQQQHEYDRRTLSGDDNRYADPQSAYSQERRELSAQSDPKKRKRNFSNRTKTGCMTCRRRKKKCDESRPECKLLGNHFS